jgi:hypothetical protein
VLTNDAQKTASRTEAVHIYAGLITPGTWVFLDADFVDAPAVPVITSLSPEDGKLTASWGSVSGVTAYEVYWHTADNTAAVPSANKLEVPSTDSLTTTITGLTNGTFYYVWVKAKNDSGVSGFSDSASGAPGFPLTDEVSPCQTITDSSSTIINPQGWTGAGTAIQRWTLNVVEKPTTYFAVIKTAAQTITVGGTNAGLVTQAPVGTTVDGSTASDTLSVFTVNSATYDLMFEGGSSDFTLTVSEPGKTSKNITVTLNVIPNLSGVAVFKVTRLAGDTAGITETLTALQAEAWATQGTLTRITGIQEIEIFYSTSFYKSQWLPSSGNRLLDAMAWVNENAQDNEEYLIRLEKNEQIPKVALTFQGRSNITMRLRGIGGERTITHDGTFPTNNGYFYADSQLDRNSRAVNGGTHLISGTYTTGPLIWNSTNITLSLEQHVTLTGLTSQINFAGYFNPNRGYCLVMLDGSKITGYTAYSNFTPIDLSTGSTASNSARFYMFGGAISGNICSANGVMNTRNPTTYTGIGAFFVKKGGSISGNVLRTDETMPANFIYFFNAANKRTIIDGHEYVVPPLFNEGD